MAAVRIEAKAFTDLRFKALGKAMGQDVLWALGAMASVWSHCTEEETDTITRGALDAIGGDGFADALATEAVDLAEAQPDGRFRMRGGSTDDRLFWLRNKRRAGKLGGKKSKESRHLSSKRQAKGNPIAITPAIATENILLPVQPPEVVDGGFDFDAIYQAYPRKQGKALGMARCQEEINTPERYQALVKAVANYSKLVKDTEPKFIKLFSTFMSHWTDYLDRKPIELSSPSPATPPRPQPSPEELADRRAAFREFTEQLQERARGAA